MPSIRDFLRSRIPVVAGFVLRHCWLDARRSTGCANRRFRRERALQNGPLGIGLPADEMMQRREKRAVCGFLGAKQKFSSFAETGMPPAAAPPGETRKSVRNPTL
jgi:hypothetical protein